MRQPQSPFSPVKLMHSAPAAAPRAAGGSLGRVGVFSLGIVPYINASILLQLLATAFPSLKKLQREEGPQGRARFQQYQKLAALVFAVAQAAGQLTYLRPYVDDFSAGWLAESVLLLTTGAMILVYVSCRGRCGAGRVRAACRAAGHCSLPSGSLVMDSKAFKNRSCIIARICSSLQQ